MPTIVSAPPGRDSIAVSVVSHAQGTLVAALLKQLAAWRDPLVRQVIVTHNLPEEPLDAPAQGWPFELSEVFNEEPASFAANHNRAFAHGEAACFCVINPDVELPDANIWSRLIEAVQQPGVGCAYPRLLNDDGSVQDNEREAVTPLALFRRHVLKRPQRRADWVSGAFLLVPADVWRSLGGFDTRFKMYCEDADFCLRLRLAGWRILRADATARHSGARSSRRPGRRMLWHIGSLLRFWIQPPLRRYLASLAKARQ